MGLSSFGFKAALFYFLMVGAFFITPYSNLFFLLVSFLSLQWVFCAVWTWRNLSGLSATLGALHPVPVGSKGIFVARLKTTRKVCFQASLEIELEGDQVIAAQASLVEGEVEVSVSAAKLARGVYPVQRVRLISSYPLGLFVRRRTIQPLAGKSWGELVCYPAPSSLVEERDGADGVDELQGLASAQGDLQPSGLREYVQGDELRSVHWRASARKGSLVCREWEGGRGEGIEVLLDRRCEPVELDEALSTLTALIALARAEKEVLAITSQNLVATFGEGHRPWREALRFTAVADVLPSDAPAPPPVSPSVTRLTPTHAC